MIRQILDAVDARGGLINLEELSQQVGVQTAALQGILDFCVQKGYLDIGAGDESACSACALTSVCKPGPQHARCVIISKKQLS